MEEAQLLLNVASDDISDADRIKTAIKVLSIVTIFFDTNVLINFLGYMGHKNVKASYINRCISQK